MRYIWKPGHGKVMHYQFHDAAGNAYNQSLCGIVFADGHNTINPPFGLGRPRCKNCVAIADGKRPVIDRRAA